MYDFPFGRSELYGLAYRTDYDLQQHAKHSGKSMDIVDNMTGEKITPHVIEPTFGLDRSILAVLCEAYEDETLEDGSTRTVLKLPKTLAPVHVACFPLMKKPELVNVSRQITNELMDHFNVEYDEKGAIGKRYRRHDEIGTPICITVDFDTLEDKTVTIRYRDSMKQVRVSIADLKQAVSAELMS